MFGGTVLNPKTVSLQGKGGGTEDGPCDHGGRGWGDSWGPRGWKRQEGPLAGPLERVQSCWQLEHTLISDPGPRAGREAARVAVSPRLCPFVAATPGHGEEAVPTLPECWPSSSLSVGLSMGRGLSQRQRWDPHNRPDPTEGSLQGSGVRLPRGRKGRERHRRLCDGVSSCRGRRSSVEGEEGATRLPSVWPQGGAVPELPRGVSRAQEPAPLDAWQLASQEPARRRVSDMPGGVGWGPWASFTVRLIRSGPRWLTPG